MSKHVEEKIDQIHIRAVMLCMSKTSTIQIHKGCNAMYVEDVEDIKTSHNRCILKYVKDVEDRSNTHKGCNDRSKIIHIRAVMLCYVEDVKEDNRCILK